MKPHPLVGTWERIALTVDRKVVQPPAPQIVLLGDDGWFSQTQLPTGRQRVGKPLEQYTQEDFVNSFKGVAAARATYNVEGNTLSRKHVANVDPNRVGQQEVGQFSLEGDTITLRGSNPSGGKFEAKFRRLQPRDVYAN